MPKPLTDAELMFANEQAIKIWSGKNPVVKQPDDNTYNDVTNEKTYRVLKRTDGLHVVHHVGAWPPDDLVYHSEIDARVAALRLTS